MPATGRRPASRVSNSFHPAAFWSCHGVLLRIIALKIVRNPPNGCNEFGSGPSSNRDFMFQDTGSRLTACRDMFHRHDKTRINQTFQNNISKVQ